jgi:murein DD-endopeptidase MepM/ murein hydrolase activator NlpD
MRDMHTLLFLFSKKCFYKFAILFLCIIIPLAGAQVVTEYNRNELLKEAEKIYKLGQEEEAYAKIVPLLPLKQSQLASNPIFLQIQASLVASGNRSLLTYDYIKCLDYYDKALAITADKKILAQKEAIITEINTPKVLVEGMLLKIDNVTDTDEHTNICSNYLANRMPQEKITFEQGDPLRIKFLWSEELQNLKFKLLSSKQKIISQANAFKLNPRLNREQEKSTCWYAFLTAYVEQPAATFNVIIEATKNNAEKITWQGTVELLKKPFPECTINLNAKLTTLKTKPDPKKEEETKYLWDLMNTCNIDAQYHTDNFILPLQDAIITTQFGEKTIFAYNTGKKSTSTHIGIDYAKPAGTPIKAMGNGKVVLARDRIISGLSVVIEHMPGVFTMYFHLSKLLVKEGELVATGQAIGEVGSTGLSTGAHLHLAMEICGVSVNPEFFIRNKLIFD